MRYTWPRVLLLLCGAFAPGMANAGGIRVALLADAEVQGDTILLANLLPENAPRVLRGAAEKIMLGFAPQNGTSRRLSGDTIAAAIQDGGLSRASFLVPETVTVHRSSHLITPQESWTAIQTFLRQHPVRSLSGLRLDDLTLEAVVAVPEDAAKPVVTRLTFDDALHRARFRLRLPHAAASQAFYVTARISSGTTGSALPSFHEVAAVPDAVDASARSESVLVDPRQTAHLRLHSADSEMLLTVQPLQRGRLDETIRVRLRSSGKTLQARVVGENALEAVF